MPSLRRFASGLLRPVAKAVGARYTSDWDETRPGMSRRQYDSYGAYLEHQAAKLDEAGSLAGKYDEEIRIALGERLPEEIPAGCRVLCLGARLGGEVRAFRDRGAFAWGIDLNPGKDNPYVCFGDFHSLVIPDESVDIVYCNVMDHVYEVTTFIQEIRRILRSDGRVLLEVMDYNKEAPGSFEALYWKSTDDLLSIFTELGFCVDATTTFNIPWAGTCFELVVASQS